MPVITVEVKSRNVKTWGKEKDIPVLVVHGLGDNAGSFDRMMPYLPTSFYYICMDLPSHGKSSPFPPHTFIAAIDNVITIKLVLDHLKLKRYILMGHSWGGHICIFFTQIYPEYVLKLITFDGFYLYPIPADNMKDYLIDKIDSLMKVNDGVANIKPRTYTYEEAVAELIETKSEQSILSRESAEALLKRSLVPIGNEKYELIIDPRLKAYLDPLFNLNFAINSFRRYPITCPVLFIYASDSEKQYHYFKPIIEQFQAYSKECVIENVTGNHNVHNNNPGLVGPIVSKFLMTTNTSKL